MRNITDSPEPGSRFRILVIVTLTLLILSSIWIFYDMYAYLEMRANPAPEEFPENGLGIGFIIRIVLYVSFAFMMFRAFKNGLKINLLTVICTLTGVVSGIWVVLDWAALVDIWHDYRSAGDCALEWNWLFISLAVQLSFCITGILFVYSLMKGWSFGATSAKSIINEAFFEIAQYVGTVCGLAGLTFTVYADVTLHDWNLRNWLIRLIMFYCLVIILPWLLMVALWLWKLARQAEKSLYDEKQKSDLALSGLTAWLVSIPVMAGVFISDLTRPGSATGFLWLPYYLFSTLFIFSLSLLIRFRTS